MDGCVHYAGFTRFASAEYFGHATRLELFFLVTGYGTFGYFIVGVAVGVCQVGEGRVAGVSGG